MNIIIIIFSLDSDPHSDATRPREEASTADSTPAHTGHAGKAEAVSTTPVQERPQAGTDDGTTVGVDIGAPVPGGSADVTYSDVSDFLREIRDGIRPFLLRMLVNVMYIHMYYICICFFFLLDVDSGRRLSDVVRLPPLHGERLLYAHEAL